MGGNPDSENLCLQVNTFTNVDIDYYEARFCNNIYEKYFFICKGFQHQEPLMMTVRLLLVHALFLRISSIENYTEIQ